MLVSLYLDVAIGLNQFFLQISNFLCQLGPYMSSYVWVEFAQLSWLLFDSLSFIQVNQTVKNWKEKRINFHQLIRNLLNALCVVNYGISMKSVPSKKCNKITTSAIDPWSLHVQYWMLVTDPWRDPCWPLVQVEKVDSIYYLWVETEVYVDMIWSLILHGKEHRYMRAELIFNPWHIGGSTFFISCRSS